MALDCGECVLHVNHPKCSESRKIQFNVKPKFNDYFCAVVGDYTVPLLENFMTVPSLERGISAVLESRIKHFGAFLSDILVERRTETEYSTFCPEVYISMETSQHSYRKQYGLQGHHL